MKKTTPPLLDTPPPSRATKTKTSELVPRSARLKSKPFGPLPKQRRSKVPNGTSGNGGEDKRELDAAHVLSALMALRNGDFSIRLPAFWTGIAGKVADTFN